MKCILYNEMHFYIMKIDREAFFRAMVGTKGYKEKTLSGNVILTSSSPNPHLILIIHTHPHLILTSSSPHPHRILTSSSSSSPHPHLILTSSSPHPRHPHLDLIILTES